MRYLLTLLFILTILPTNLLSNQKDLFEKRVREHIDEILPPLKMWYLIEDANLSEVKKLLDNGYDVNQEISYFKRTPIYVAIEKNNLELVKLFVAYGADLDYEDEQYFNTPLNYAQSLVGDFSEIRSYLFKQKWDREKNSDAICWAATNNNIEGVKQLLEMGIDINYRDKIGGETALLWAVASGKLEMVKYLLKQGADIHALSRYDTNSIDIAEEEQYKKIVKYLNLHYPNLSKAKNPLPLSIPILTVDELKRCKKKEMKLEEKEKIAQRIKHISSKLLVLRKPQRVWRDILEKQSKQVSQLIGLQEHFLTILLFENMIKVSQSKYSDDKVFLGNLYYNLGSLYIASTEYAKGVKFLKKALPLYTSLYPLTLNLPSLYHQFGVAYRFLGDYEASLEHYKIALDLKKREGLPKKASLSSYIGLADLYNHLGNYTQSLKYNSVALSLAPHKFKKGTIYLNMSISYMKLGDYKKALRYATQSFEIAQQRFGKEHMLMGGNYSALGEIYYYLQNYKKSLHYYKKSLEVSQKFSKNNFPIAQKYRDMAKTYIKMKQFDKAYDSIKIGFDRFVSIRNDYFSGLNHFHKKTFLKQNNDFLASLLEIGYEVKGENGDIFNRWLNYKRTIFDMENSLKILYAKTTDKEVKERINTLFKKQRKLARLTLSFPKNSKKIEAYNKKVKKIKEAISQEEIFLSAKVLGLHTSKITYRDIVKILNPKELYIDFAKVENGYFCFTLDKQGSISFKRFTLQESQKIDKIVSIIREDMGKYFNDKISKKRYGKLYNLIIKKLNIKDKTSLIISPDGLLGLIPFEAFYDQDREQYLVEKVDIRYIPSGRELVKLSRNRSRPKSQKVVLFSEVNFNYNLTKRPRLKGSFLGNLEANWHYLHGSKEESKIIQAIFGKEVISFLGKHATQANLFKVEAPKILHLSTHGIFIHDHKQLNPMERSLLLLSGANESIRQHKEEGLVSGLKLAGLNLKGTELVVLSACETAVGEIEEGEGVAGLNKAFIEAGAKHIVMSLWSVDDKASSQLMVYFYQNIQNGDDYTLALNRAKRSMIKRHREGQDDPFFWSGFIISG